MRLFAIVPVKDLEESKSRLSHFSAPRNGRCLPW